MPPGSRIVEEDLRPREQQVQLGGEENRSEARKEPPTDVPGGFPHFPFLPSLSTLFRIGLVVALLVQVQAVAERLSWRTDGLPFGVNVDPTADRLWIQDFASIFGLTKAVVTGVVDTPYTAEGQLEFMRQWVGHRVDVALGYGYSPTLWLILAPLLPLPAILAYVVWSFVPAVLLFSIGWWLVARGWGERNPFALTLLLVAFASGAYHGEVQLGQTAVVLGAIAFAVIATAYGTAPWGGIALLLFLSTAKPPLALALGVGLLWNRQVRPVVAAVGLVAVEVTCVTVWLGPGWVTDYADLLAHYTSDSGPEAFRAFLDPAGMSNLRNLLASGAGWSDRDASLASAAAGVGATAAGTWLVATGRLPAGPLRPAFALFLYTLFSPHLTFNNDLLVVIVAWFLHAERKLSPAERAMVLGLLVVVLNAGPFKTFLLDDTGAHLAFLAKVAMLVFFLRAAAQPARAG